MYRFVVHPPFLCINCGLFVLDPVEDETYVDGIFRNIKEIKKSEKPDSGFFTPCISHSVGVFTIS